jgi:ubiquitin carboxyl-terminal hydrolase 36/42
MASLAAVAVAVAVVALATAAWRWLQCAAERREEVRRLAWLASEEVEFAEREAYYYANHGSFGRAADVTAAAPLWTAPEVVASPRVEEEEEREAATEPLEPPARGKKGSCAVCRRQTSFRCKRCKGVNYWSVRSLPCPILLLFDCSSCRLSCRDIQQVAERKIRFFQ